VGETVKSYYNLNDFENEQDNNAAVFRNGQWGQCLDLIKHLCQYSENILLASGKEGMGKTTLKNTLKNLEDKNFKFLDIQASAISSVSKLMQNIAVGFGISFDSQEAPANSNKNNVWVLLIDDADLLSLELVGALFQLRESANGLLHIVLFAKLSLESRILESTWREACETYVHVIELEPLTLSETESLLQHQWKLVGNKVNLPFDRAAINNIHALSGGITREVLKLAKSQINGEEVVGNNKTLFSTFLSVLSPVMLGLTVLFGIVFILISFFLPSDIDANLATVNNETDVQPQESEVVLMEEATPLSLEETTVEIPEIVAQSSALATPVEPKVEATTAQKTPENDLLLQTTEHKVEEKIITEQHVSSQALPLPEGKPIIAEVIPTITNKTLDLKPRVAANEKSILGIAANKFTIQLLGAAQEKRILEFIEANNLTDQAQYYRTTHNDKPWFILIYGSYASRAEATEAVKVLPKEVQSLKPWTRDIASIQKVIKKES